MSARKEVDSRHLAHVVVDDEECHGFVLVGQFAQRRQSSGGRRFSDHAKVFAEPPTEIVLERVPAQIDKQLVSKPEESPFFKPFKKFPDAILNAERELLAQAAKEAITAGVLPSFQKLKKYFLDE